MPDSLRRQWLMLSLLPRAPRKIDAASLEELLRERGVAVDRRSVQRDLKALSAAFPILRDERTKPFGWSWSKDGPAVEEALERARREGLGGWPSKVRVVPGWRASSGEVRPGLVGIVDAALAAGVRLAVTYRGRSEAPVASFEFHPLALVYRDGNGYLVGSVGGSVEITELGLHGIVTAREVRRPARAPRGFDLDAYVRRARIGFAFGDGIVGLRALVDAQVASGLQDWPIGREQKLIKHDADRMLLSAVVADSSDLRRWLIELGDALEVLEPVTLREELVNVARRFARRYGVESQKRKI